MKDLELEGIPSPDPAAVALELRGRRMRAAIKLKLAADQAAVLQREVDEAAYQLHYDLGMSWAVIGLALGITRQAAHQRYGIPS